MKIFINFFPNNQYIQYNLSENKVLANESPSKGTGGIGLSSDNNYNMILFKEIKICFLITKIRKNGIPAKPY